MSSTKYITPVQYSLKKMFATNSTLNQIVLLVLAVSTLAFAASSGTTDSPRKSRQGLLPSGLPPVAGTGGILTGSLAGGNILPFAMPMILLGLGIVLLPMLIFGGQFLSMNGFGIGDSFLGGGFGRTLSDLKRKPGFPDLTELIKTVAEALEKVSKD